MIIVVEHLYTADISKWVIYGWSKIGLAWDLKRTPKSKYDLYLLVSTSKVGSKALELKV